MDIRAGDALVTLSADLPESIDLLLLDGAKALYPDILGLLESRLRPGACVVADNADYSPEYLRARALAVERLSVDTVRRRRRAIDADQLTEKSGGGGRRR